MENDVLEVESKQKGRAVKSAQKKKVNRVHVSYPDSMKDRLEAILEETDKSSLSEVFRQALLLYALAHEEHKKGSELIIRNKDGEQQRLMMFF